MVIALTGATGFVGQRIVQQLRLVNHRLRCLVREDSDVSHLRSPAIELIYGDLDESESLDRLSDGAAVVVHAAAWHDGAFQQIGREQPFEHIEKNVDGSLKLLEFARTNCDQFIFISSGSVYGNPAGNAPLAEDSPRDPDTAYGAYKASVEMFCQSYARQFDFNACVLRPVAVIGAHSNAEESPYFDLVRRVIAGERIEVGSGQKAVMVEDVARAVAFVIGREDVKGQVYNLCGGWVRQQDVAQMAAKILGSGANVVGTPQSGPQHEMSSAKIIELGFRFTGQEGLNNYVRELVRAAGRVEQPS